MTNEQINVLLRSLHEFALSRATYGLPLVPEDEADAAMCREIVRDWLATE